MSQSALPTILRFPAVKGAYGVSKSTIYSQIQQGLLTKPVHLTKRTAGWPAHEISELLAARIAGKTEDEIRLLVA